MGGESVVKGGGDGRLELKELRNLTQNIILAERLRVAKTWWQRARGMIGNHFDEFDALLLPECGAVHTWFMRKSLDLIFLAEEGRVLRFEMEAPPWKMRWGPRGTRAVIELPSGCLRGKPVRCNDLLRW